MTHPWQAGRYLIQGQHGSPRLADWTPGTAGMRTTEHWEGVHREIPYTRTVGYVKHGQWLDTTSPDPHGPYTLQSPKWWAIIDDVPSENPAALWKKAVV